MEQNFSYFLPIQKIDEEQRMVWGYASTPTKDLQGEIVPLDAIKAALPDYMKWANIREMHSNSAVGVTKEANVDENGLYIGARIADDAAWMKCKEKVYKGFSIGGSKLEKVGDTIHKLRMTEISLVDRPANPDCRIDVAKAAGVQDEFESNTLLAKAMDVIKALALKLTPAGHDGFSLPAGPINARSQEAIVQEEVEKAAEAARKKEEEEKEKEKQAAMEITDLQKRMAAAHGAALSKAQHHLAKAMSLHGKAMAKCASCIGKAAKMAKEAGDAETGSALEHVHGLLSEMGDHHDLVQHNLSKAMSGGKVEESGKFAPNVGADGEVSPANREAIDIHDTGHMTEGHVADTGMFATNSPYSAGALADTIKKSVEAAMKPLADQLHAAELENATMKGQMQVLSNLPSNRRGAQLWSGSSIAKSVGSGDAKDEVNAEIMKAAQSVDENDPDSAIRASARIIGLRAMSPRLFGKSITDPNYQGQVG